MFFRKIIWISVLFSIANTAFADNNIQKDILVPVTDVCISLASEYYNVPLAALLGIMAVERGTVGKYSKNENGTWDMGPMQINSVWIPEFKKYGITEKMILNNGCLNVFLGAWILSNHYKKSDSIWEAIGNYHSKHGRLNQKYQNLVYKKIRSIKNCQDIIDKANESLN